MASFNPANPFGGSGGGNPYKALRDQATEDAGANQSQGQDAITRRFAAMGNLNSGSYVQAMNDNSKNAQQGLNSNLANIGMAEQGAALPYAQMAQQEGQFEKGLTEQQSEFGVTSQQKNRALDLEAEQQQLDAGANALNYELGQRQMINSGGLLGGGGFLGFGFGRKSGGFLG